MAKDKEQMLSHGIVAYIADEKKAVDVRDLLTKIRVREGEYVNGASDREIMLTIYRLVDSNELAFTTDRRLKIRKSGNGKKPE